MKVELNPFAGITKSNMRTGTKFAILNFIFTMLIISFLIVGLPLLAIKWQIFVTVIEKMNISSIIIALLGQSGLATVANEIRKAVESKTKQIDHTNLKNLDRFEDK
jgi:hypothetical protein